MSTVSLWRNCNAATFDHQRGDAWGWLENAAIAVCDREHTIKWVGSDAERVPPEMTVARTHDLRGACVTPALIDCHTHLVYAGDRAREFEMRLNGATYEEISKAGGGIRSTVAATRAATDDELFFLTEARARALMREGVATIEIKSGYGLTEHDEARSLRVARRVGRALGIDVKTTFLGAHALPTEFANRADDYIEAICEWMPRLHAEGLVDAVDAFCENIGFSAIQTRRVFEAAKCLGVPVKLHAEQLSDQGGTLLATEYNALSCDHLEYLTDSAIAAMASSGTVAVMLPAAFYFLRESTIPPISKLRHAGVRLALATDHNPGSSPTLSPLLVMNMACTLFRMTPLEAWQGFTRHAARALGMNEDVATISVGAPASFAVWQVAHPRELCYRIGGESPLHSLVVRGETKIEHGVIA